MAFERIDPPDPKHFIRPDFKPGFALPGKTPPNLSPLPSSRLFADELRFWHQRFASAPQKRDTFGRAIGKHLIQGLQDLAAERTEVSQMRDGHLPFQAGYFQEWYRLSAVAFAFSRLVRAFGDHLGSDITVVEDVQADPVGEPGLLWDVELSEPDKSAFHIGREYVEELGLGPPELDGTVWYEGESIYVQATHPARLTETLALECAVSEGYYDLEMGQFVSMAPRLKAEVWDG
jgi:hypothetical protein